MHPSRPGTFRATVIGLVLLTAAPAEAQVGGPPAPPATIWQFLGIPQGIKKLQGATRNRRGNHPNLEPKPPMRAIADPRNLESPDPSIKKAAEVKIAEDLKAQKIKAVKYLASIGCGCYDIDGGVTAALVASMQDCTEDVRYETINAVAEASQAGACARCGEGCCCNKEVLQALSKIAYERADDGCWLEPSARVRQAAAEALVICCPNSSPPVIVEAEPEPVPVPRETGDDEEDLDDRELDVPPGPLPIPPVVPAPPTPNSVEVLPPRDEPRQFSAADVEQFTLPSGAPFSAEGYGLGVVVHSSPQHGLAHLHFTDSELQANVGAAIGIYATVGDRRELVAKVKVVESFPGSANVTASTDELANIAQGDLALCPPTVTETPRTQVAATPVETPVEAPVSAEWITSENWAQPHAASHVQAAAAPKAQPVEAKATPAMAIKPAAPSPIASSRNMHGTALRKAATSPRSRTSGFVR